MVKHMTDEPYSYDEFSYGRIPSQDRTTTTTSTTTMTPVIPHEEEEDDQWKIFPRNTQVGLKSSKNDFKFFLSFATSTGSDAVTLLNIFYQNGDYQRREKKKKVKIS